MIFHRIFSVAVVLCLAAVSPSRAAEPFKDPALRIETGMHTQNIRSVATDRIGSVMATAGFDKSIRIWSLRDGKLLKVMRPPLGSGNESLLYTVAITADGSLVACGGLTSFSGGKPGKPEDGYNVYFFSRSSGKMLKRISGLPSVIDTLDFSPDGTLLAVGYQGGMRTYRIRSGHDGISATAASDEPHDKTVRLAATKFSPDGRVLFSAGFDGVIKRYDVSPTGSLSQSAIRDSSRDPIMKSSLSISPDGKKLAVGYSAAARIDILDASDLSVLDTRPLSANSNAVVAWAPDGVRLYAAGTIAFAGVKSILQFDENLRITRYKNPFSGYITSLAVLSDGRIIATSDTPGIVVYSRTGELLFEKYPTQLTFANVKEKLKVSRDGLTVLLAMQEHDPHKASIPKRLLFSLGDRMLTTVSPAQGGDGFGRQIYNHENFKIEKGKAEFSVNGKTIKLASNSAYRYHVVSADGESALVATNFIIYCVDRAGKILWSKSSPQTASDLAISEDGRVAIFANASGTLAWFNMKDGAWLISLVFIKDNQRWVLWTPYGYYDASPGGEDLIGWHINNGKDKAADFFPASRFRKEKYRPELISSFIEDFNLNKLRPATKPQIQAVDTAIAQQADDDVSSKEISGKLPPVITIISPQEGSRISTATIVVDYEATSPGDSPVTGIRVLIDGRPSSTASRSLKAVDKKRKNGAQTITITVPEKDSEISLVAENRHGSSVPSSIRLIWGGTAIDESLIKPKLYALVVGVSEYAQKDLTLKFAAKDARDFAQALLRQKNGLYRDVVVKVLTDRQATRDDIMDGLDWLQKETTSRDIAIVFIAGHGVNDSTGVFYYLPHNTDPEKLKRTGIANTDIKNTLTSLPGKAILFMDTCHSGNVMGGRRALSDINSVVNELSSAENGVVVFASSTGRQYSLEDDAWGNGAFTKALVAGLDGGADVMKNGRITINGLDLYLSEEVKRLTGGKQTPTTTKPQTVPDFPLAMKR